MERTNYVDKAKALMLKAARTSALVVVPLAAAVSAHAGSIALPTSNFVCTANDSGSCSSGAVAANPDPGTGVQGISFSGFSEWFVGGSGGTIQLQLEMQASGTLPGEIPAGTSLPVGWSFNLGAFSGGGVQTWSLVFELGDSSGSLADLGSTATSGSGTGLFTGSGSFLVSDIPSGSSIFETAILTINATSSGGGDVTVNVPSSSSFDFNSTANVASTPEPASIGLIGAGLAFFGALVRRRRRQ